MSLLLSLVAVYLLTAVAGGLAAALLSRRLELRHLPSAHSAACLLGPALAAAGICAGLVWPGLAQGGCHCLAQGPQQPHLCFSHPDYADSLFLPAAAVAAVWACSALPRLGGLLVDLWRTHIWSRRVAKTRVQACDGVRFRLIDAPALGACTTGLLWPLIAVDESLWSKLDREQRRAVLHHENAHRLRLDPLSLVVLRACSALCLVPAACELLRRWQVKVELECDRHAATIVGDPDVVAAALLAVQRHRRTGEKLPLPSGVAATGGDLDGRIRALLDPSFRHEPACLRNDVLAAALLGAVVIVVLALCGGEALHHATETLLGVLVGAP